MSYRRCRESGRRTRPSGWIGSSCAAAADRNPDASYQPTRICRSATAVAPATGSRDLMATLRPTCYPSFKVFLNLTKGTQKRNYWCKDSRTLKVTFNEQSSNWNGKLQGIRYCRLLQRKFQFLSLQSVANISRLNMSSRASPELSSFLKRILTNCHPQIEATAQEKKNDEKQWKKWNQIMACLWEKRGLPGPSNLQKYHIHIGKH